MPSPIRARGAGSGAVRLRDLTEQFRQSLFALPAVFAVLGAVLGWFLSEVVSPGSLDGAPALLRPSRETGTAVLTTVATGTMSAVSIVFAVMLVALQLSSSRFSPRVVREFVGDRHIQVVMGIEIGTVTFALTALLYARGSGNGQSLSSLTVLVGAVLGVIALLALLAAVNHLAHSLQVGSIAERVTLETLSLINDSTDDQGRISYCLQAPSLVPAAGSESGVGTPIVAWAEGWVQQIGFGALEDLVPDGHRLVLDIAIGSYVSRDTPLAWIIPEVDDTTREEVARLVRAAIDVGHERTMQQDIGYGIVRLQDIALLAFSSSLNDLNTGIEAIVRLGSVLTALMVRDIREPLEISELVPVRRADFSQFVQMAFDEVRISAAPHPVALVAMLRTLGRIKDEACRRGHHGAVRAVEHQGRLVLEGLESGQIFLAADRQRVRDVAFAVLFTDTVLDPDDEI